MTSAAPDARNGLTALVERVTKEAGVAAEIVTAEDIAEIVKRGALSTPALVIDDGVK